MRRNDLARPPHDRARVDQRVDAMTSPLHDLRSLDRLFRPQSIAVLGASSDPAKIGGRPVRFLKKVGYKGRVFPVNPRYPEVQGLKSYASVRDIEGPVDLAVIEVDRKSTRLNSSH